MRKAQQPLTLSVHGDVTTRINNIIIGIKMNGPMPANEDPEKWQKVKEHYPAPSQTQLIELLTECYKIIDSVRESPIKY